METLIKVNFHKLYMFKTTYNLNDGCVVDVWEVKGYKNIYLAGGTTYIYSFPEYLQIEYPKNILG